MTRFTHKSKIAFSTIIITFILWTVTTIFIESQALSHIKSHGKIINISGIQRMLSQKITLHASMYLNKYDTNLEQELNPLLSKFNDNYIYIRDFIDESNPNLESLYLSMDNKSLKFLEIVKKFINNPTKDNFNNLYVDSQIILPLLDKAVFDFEKMHELELKHLKNLKIGLEFFIYFILFLEVVFLAIPAIKEKLEIESELNQLKNAIDKTTIVSKTDSNGIITYVNEQFESISGYKKDELIGKPHNMVRHEDMQKSVFKEIWKTIKNKQTWHGVIKNRHKDGGYYVVDAYIIPLLDSKNDIIEYIAIRHDITELDKFKEILKKQLDDTNSSMEEQSHYLLEYEQAIDNTNAIAKTDLNLTLTHVNSKYAELSKYSEDEMIGRPITSFVAEESLTNVDEILKTIISGETYSDIFKGKPKSGKPYYTKTFIKPMKNLEGKLNEILFIKSDVTDLIELQNEITKTQREIVEKLGNAGEKRSKETGDHVKRVADYSYLLAKLAGLSEDEATLLKDASPMHDIGKIAIADEILNKPGKLTVEEFEIMKLHTQYGYDIIGSSEREILKAASIVANQHHEKYDGSGYPQGLKDEQIHIYGRITAIADVFDALGHDRVYKKAWELSAILELLEKEKGTHFDPNLVDLFLNNLDKFLEIKQKYD